MRLNNNNNNKVTCEGSFQERFYRSSLKKEKTSLDCHFNKIPTPGSYMAEVSCHYKLLSISHDLTGQNKSPVNNNVNILYYDILY